MTQQQPEQPDMQTMVREGFTKRMGQMVAEAEFNAQIGEAGVQMLMARVQELEAELQVANDTVVELTAQVERAQEGDATAPAGD